LISISILVGACSEIPSHGLGSTLSAVFVRVSGSEVDEVATEDEAGVGEKGTRVQLERPDARFGFR